MIAANEIPTRRRPREYRVLTFARNNESGRHEILAYDAADAAAQAELLMTMPGETVVGVEPAMKPGPEAEWGSRKDVAAILGLGLTATTERLGALEAEYGLGHIGDNSGKQYHLPTVKKLLLEMSERERVGR